MSMRDEFARFQINPTWPPKGRVRRTILGVAAATAAAGTIMVLSAAGGSVTAGADPSSITLCHATASVTHPYVVITVAPNSINQKIFGKNGHNTHTGPIFDPNGGKDQPAWGDIIPSFDWNDPVQHYPGLNWPAGAAILDANCVVTVQPSTQPPSSEPGSSTPPSTESSQPGSSTPPSGSSSFSFSGSQTSNVSTSGSHGISGVATSNGPIPNGVSAGLHTPVADAGLKAWGVVLMVLGGAAGLLAGLWPTRRRAH
jgi:hypothetical protein